MWELDRKEAEVDKITITPFLFGCPPEALTDISFYIENIYLQEVEADYVLGWELNNRIAYCHCGYFNKGTKIALTQNFNESEKFYIIDENQNIVFSDQVTIKTTELGTFNILNFTKFEVGGYYKIKIAEYETKYFEISNNPYLSSIVKSLNF